MSADSIAAATSLTVTSGGMLDIHTISGSGADVILDGSAAGVATHMLGKIAAQTLTVNAGAGEVTQGTAVTDAHTITGTAHIQAGGGITLTNTGNQYTGPVTLRGGMVSLTNAIVLNAASVTGGVVTLNTAMAGTGQTGADQVLGTIVATDLHVDAGAGEVTQNAVTSPVTQNAHTITGTLRCRGRCRHHLDQCRQPIWRTGRPEWWHRRCSQGHREKTEHRVAGRRE